MKKLLLFISISAKLSIRFLIMSFSVSYGPEQSLVIDSIGLKLNFFPGLS